MLLAASSTPWPVIIVWIVAVLFARLAKSQKTPPPRPLARPDPTLEARADMGDALQRAMEKLRQAEREAKQGPAAPDPARAAARPPIRPSVRLTLEDRSAQSQESEPEVVDYDDAAAGIAETRARDAEAFERGDVSASPRAQATSAVASARTPDRPSAPLSRYADGSLRGAIIVAEILGRPISQR